jgi:hypothetical protein
LIVSVTQCAFFGLCLDDLSIPSSLDHLTFEAAGIPHRLKFYSIHHELLAAQCDLPMAIPNDFTPPEMHERELVYDWDI